MNMLLLFPEDFYCDDRVILRGRRAEHLIKVVRVAPGLTLKVGLAHGPLGYAVVRQVESDVVYIQIQSLRESAPSASPVKLVLALPRPKILGRLLQMAVTLGIKHIILLNSYRVDKSYWQSPMLHAGKLEQQVILGLEQAVDTQFARIDLQRRFRPFVEDVLPGISQDSQKWVAHPSGGARRANFTSALERGVTLCVGPEGGFIPFEIKLLQQQGFSIVSLGSRILRTETAFAALCGYITGL